MRRLLAILLALLALTPLIGPLVELLPSYGPQRPTLLASEVTIEGDPVSDEEVVARGETGGEPWSLRIERTPAGVVDQAPESERVREASPLGPVDAHMSLKAGPVVLEDAGNVSPAFPLHARVAVDEDDGVDRAWLRLAGEAWAPLQRAGVQEGREVHLAALPAGTLPGERTTHVDVVFERQLAPDTKQHVQGPGWDVYADDSQPPPPTVSLEDGEIHLEGSGERFEAAQRSHNGSWQPASVENGSVEDLQEDTTEVRVRSVDEVGNEGPWSDPVQVDSVDRHDHEAVGSWDLLAPEDGARVEGPVHVDWRPRTGVQVEVRARQDPSADWRPVGEASQPPIVWRTGFVPDGSWELHVRAEQGSGLSSRILTLTVDNLAEDTLAPAEPEPDATPPTRPTPRTSSPLSAVLASGAGLLALTGLAGRAWTRRPK